MSDIFSKATSVITTAEQDVTKAVAWVSHLYDSVSTKLSALAKEEPQLVSSISDLVEKGEVFLATSVPAITDKGLDIPADTAAFAALEAFVKSFEAAASVLKQLITEAK